jgi:hypothetical protein
VTDIGLWRRYEIGTLSPETLAALLEVIWALCERLQRRPTTAEIQQAVRGS